MDNEYKKGVADAKAAVHRLLAKSIRFECFVRGATEVWAKPSSFGTPVLSAAYRAVHQVVPWYYRSVRCLYTLNAVAGVKCSAQSPEEEHLGIHNALADVKHQAEVWHACMRVLG